MTTEQLHHAGENARLDHTRADIRFRHLVSGFETALIFGAVALLAFVAVLMIVL